MQHYPKGKEQADMGRIWGRRIGRRVLVFLLVSAMMMGFVQPLAAESLEDLTKRSKDIQNRQDKATEDLSNFRDVEKEIEDAITELEEQIADAEAQVTLKEAARAAVEVKVKEAQTRVDAKQADVAQCQKVMRSRANAQYKDGNVGALELLLQAKDFSDLLARAEYLKRLEEKDRKELNNLKTSKEQLESEKANLAAQMEAQETLKNEALQAKAVLDEKTEEHKGALAENKKRQDELAREIDALEKEAEEVGEKIKEIQDQSQKEGSSAGNGSINTWPVPSSKTISSSYRTAKRPNHTGVDVSAPQGVAIVAAGDGDVIISGWGGGYGNYVVIDHGSGMSTLYAHMVAPGIAKGTKVKAGQNIGKVGSTGNSTGPHLHFEVRKNGKDINPKTVFSWLP